MTDFEHDLRRQLVEASELAPAYEAAPTTSPRRGRRQWAVLTAGGVALAAAAAVVWWNGSGSTVQQPHAVCVAGVSLHGTTFVRRGDVVRVPAASEPLGRATPTRCAEDDSAPTPVEAFAATGFSERDVIVVDGDIWVRDGVDAASVAALGDPVDCASAQTFRVGGRVVGVGTNAGSTSGDQQLTAPFDIDVESGDGPTWLQGGYERVRFTAEVQTATTGADDATLRAALGEAEPVELELRCDQGAFDVVALRLAG